MRVRSVAWVVAIGLALAVAGAQAPSPVYLEVPGRASANVWLATEGNRVAAAWGAREPGGGTDIYFALSGDGGRTFGAPLRVSDTPGTARVNGEMAPRPVFVPRAGQPSAIDVLWVARDGQSTSVRTARSVDAGLTFGASRALQRSGAQGDRGWAAIASDRRGGVHALWLDHRAMARTGAHAGHAAHGGADPQHSGLYYSNGRAEQELLRGVCYCCKTALAAGPDGAIFAAWRHVYAGNMRDIALTISRDGGRTFAPPARVSADHWQLNGCPDDGPALDVDADGTAHIVWPTVVTQPDAHKALFYATTTDGRTFTARTRVSPAGRNIAHPQVAVGPGGDVVVLWDEIVSGRRRVFLSRMAGEGRFGAAESLSDGIAASYPVPAFADGAFVAAWTEGGGDASRIVVRRLPAR